MCVIRVIYQYRHVYTQMDKPTNKQEMDKKAQMSLSDLPNVVILLVVIALVAGVGALIQSEVQDSIKEAQDLNASESSTASNVSGDALEGIGELTAQVPLIGLVIGLVVLLVVVLGAFRMFGSRMR